MSRHRMSRPGHRMSMPGHKIVDTFFVLFYWAQNIPRHRISQAQDVSLGTRRLKKLDFWAQNRKPGHKMSWAQNLPGTKSKMGTKSTRHKMSWAQNLQAQNRGTKYLGTESPGTKSVSPTFLACEAVWGLTSPIYAKIQIIFRVILTNIFPSKCILFLHDTYYIF